MICWHKWSKWEIATATMVRRLDIPDIFRKYEHNNGNEEYKKQVQIRRCEKCGKYQQKDL